MRHKLILWFYGLMVLSSLIIVSIFINYQDTKQTDFIIKEGTIKGDLIIYKDEYGKDVSLRFDLTKGSVQYVLAGKLLAISNPEIYNLKEGDAIRVWEKKAASKNFLDKSLKHLSGIWGVQRLSDDVVLLSLEDAMNHRKGGQYLILAVFFIFMASVFSFLFYQKIKFHQK